ncbi:diguanylate cyclase [Legionella yabuuchiae]|uniref:diguanylate cyclase n=1 Tax=Legionella yabuuchiae TaxID=376727 RepID=UPI0010545F77|nr:diguanylate cyclase [Legionella yabuuchiae]
MSFMKAHSINSLYRLFVILAFLILLILNLLMFYALYNQRLIIASEQNRYQSIKTILVLLENSENLTKIARLYTLTGKKKYRDYFYDLLAIRDGKVPPPPNYSPFYWDYVIGGKVPHQPIPPSLRIKNQIEQLGFTDYELTLLKKAKAKTNALTNMEQEAIDLMDQSKGGVNNISTNSPMSKARNLLHSSLYLETKSEFLEPLEQFQLAVDLRTAEGLNQLQKKQQFVFLTIQLILLLALVLCLIIYRYTKQNVAKPIAKLRHQAEMVSLGNYNIRNKIESKNELEILGETMNTMCAHIEDDIDEREHLVNLLSKSEARFRNALECAPIGMAIRGLDGTVLQANQSLSDLLGYSPKEMKELTNSNLIHPDDITLVEETEQQLIHGKIESKQQEVRLVHKHGSTLWCLLSESLILDHQGNPNGLITQINDISRWKHDEQEKAQMHKQMSNALVVLKLRDKENAYLNKMNEMLLTCHNAEEAYEIIFITAKNLFSELSGGLAMYNHNNETMETLYQWGEDHNLKTEFLRKECWALRNGNIYHIKYPEHSMLCSHFQTPPSGSYTDFPLLVNENTIGLLTISCPKGESLGNKKQLAITFSENIKLALANIHLREALRHQATRDGLTGLYNRRYLDETLPRELEQLKRDNYFLTLAIIDIDDFKSCNDQYGHDAGDEVLKFIGKELQQGIRAGDIPCRFGGDEFVILFINAESETAKNRVDEIISRINSTRIQFQDEALPQIHLSAGLATAPDYAVSADELMRAADDALYKAKKSGKNCVQVYNLKKMQLKQT